MPDATDPTHPTDEVTLRIAAPPERIYAIVTDIAHMGQLSPECTGGAWLDGATGPAVGAVFKGTNTRGIVRWSTKNRVVESEPNRVFSFNTKQSGTRWTYRLEPDGDGTLVTESRAAFKKRPLSARVVTQLLLGGVPEHDDEMRAGMRQTLERLKQLAEAG